MTNRYFLLSLNLVLYDHPTRLTTRASNNPRLVHDKWGDLRHGGPHKAAAPRFNPHHLGFLKGTKWVHFSGRVGHLDMSVGVNFHDFPSYPDVFLPLSPSFSFGVSWTSVSSKGIVRSWGNNHTICCLLLIFQISEASVDATSRVRNIPAWRWIAWSENCILPSVELFVFSAPINAACVPPATKTITAL